MDMAKGRRAFEWLTCSNTKLCFLPQLILPVLMGGEKSGMAYPNQVSSWPERWNAPTRPVGRVLSPRHAWDNLQPSFLLTYMTISGETAEGEIQRRIQKKARHPLPSCMWCSCGSMRRLWLLSLWWEAGTTSSQNRTKASLRRGPRGKAKDGSGDDSSPFLDHLIIFQLVLLE